MRSVLVTGFALLGLAAPGLLRRVEIPPPPDNAPLPTAKLYGTGKAAFAPLPTASCAAASCHGGGHPGKPLSEHTSWAPSAFPDGPHDPHSLTYRVLFNDDSVRIGKNLGIAAPHKEALCLKCHATEGVKPEEAVNEGVGCSACHGPGEKWVPVHTLPEWKTLSHRTKWEEYGFVPTKNLVSRMMNCVSCHVGDSDREVNHDLIAAGHPRLAFEYTRFHYNPKYRKHWDEPTPQPDFEIRAWTVGQAVTLRAATDLLRSRAERAAADDPRTPWPEFSGLSCYACHQSVGDGEVRRGAGATRRPPGVPGWEVWSNAAAGVAVKLCPDSLPGVGVPGLVELAALRKLMQKPQPNPKAVAHRAGLAVAELDAWLASLQAAEDKAATPRVPADVTRKFAHALARNALSPDRSTPADHDWDALAANYLGAAAMYHAAGGQGAVPKWSEPLRGLAKELRFPTPKGGGRFDNPAGFGKIERDRVRDRFNELFDATADPGAKP